MDDISFSGVAIVSCGTLSLELNHLKGIGFLDAGHIFYTTPGLHENRGTWQRSFCSVLKRLKTKRRRSLLFVGEVLLCEH